MTDNHLRRTIASPCAACGAQPLHPCSTLAGKKLGIFCLIPEGQTPITDWDALGFHATELYEKSKAPIPMRLVCEACGTLHIDVGEFATKPHHTHTCQSCGLTWRPAIVPTVGVLFLPGYQNEPPLAGSDGRTGTIWRKGEPTGPTGRYAGEPVAKQGGQGPTSEGLGSQLHADGRGQYYKTRAEQEELGFLRALATEHPILDGSRWKYRDGWEGTVKLLPDLALIGCGPDNGPRYEWPEQFFRKAFTHVSDPLRTADQEHPWKPGNWARFKPGSGAGKKFLQVKEVLVTENLMWIIPKDDRCLVDPAVLEPWKPRLGEAVRHAFIAIEFLFGGSGLFRADELEPIEPAGDATSPARGKP